MWRFKQDQPVSDGFFNQVKLITAIVRLWNSVVGHSHFGGASHAVGMSIRVGIKIFSTVRG